MTAYTITGPGKVKTREFDDNNLLDDIQDFLGGYMETLTYLREGVVVVIHDEGKLIGLPYTCQIKRNRMIDTLVGNVAIFGIDHSDLCSITREKAIEFIGNYIL